MGLDEQISLLTLQIEQSKVELSTLSPFIQKIDTFIKADSIKLEHLNRILEDLKEPKIIVSLPEYGAIKKEVKTLEAILAAHRQELSRIAHASAVQKHKISELENARSQLVSKNQKGTLLEFKRPCKS